MVFSARQAKLLGPGEHIIVDEAPGLRLVATAMRKTWTYRYKSPVDGRMRQVALGQWPDLPVATAIGVWNELRQRRDLGVELADEKKRAAAVAKVKADRKRRDGVYTVADMIDDYLVGHVERSRKPKGVAETRRLLERETLAIAAMAPADVTRSKAFALLETLGERAPVLANSLRRELGAAWDYALDAGRIPEELPNWWRQILRGKLRSKGKIVAGQHQGRVLRSLEGWEVASLINYLPNFTALIEDLLTLYLWTGARGAEIVQMCGSEITHEKDGWWWTVPREKLKMARNELTTDLRVPLVGRALKVVQRRREVYGDGYLFPARPNTELPHVQQKVVGVAVWVVRPTTPTRRGETPKPKLKIKDWAPHDLRRTVRTTLASLGCSHEVGEGVLGHLLANGSGTYNRHAYDVERRTWLTKLSKHWEQLAAKEPRLS